MKQDHIDIDSLSDFSVPWCIHVAATLRIADRIAGGSNEIHALARAAGCDTYALHRLLTTLAMRGIFMEGPPGHFALNDAARGLLDPMRRTMLDLEDLGGRFAYAWTTLLKYVRTGQPAYQDVFGRSFWDDLDANPRLRESFDRLIGPEGHGTPRADFDIEGGWNAVHSVADVGGGTGAMLAEILKAHPHLRGILVDLPTPTASSAKIFTAAGVSERVTTAAQSFFEPLPGGADLYILRGIINDWPDAEAAAILRRCADAARPSGRVIVLKSVGPNDEPAGLAIEMILLGGKHRSLSAFRTLASEAGLAVVAAGAQPSGMYVVECRPVPI